MRTGTYIVALRYTAKAGGYNGIITANIFSSREEFVEFCKCDGGINMTLQEIVEEGISLERAIELAKKTAAAFLIRVAFANATDQKTGLVNPEALRLEMDKAMYGIGLNWS